MLCITIQRFFISVISVPIAGEVVFQPRDQTSEPFRNQYGND